MKIDYVIVAYNSARDIAECLDAIDADRPSGSAIIVVDNASPDDSAEIAARHRSAPVVIRTGRNGGFGAGCNVGIAASAADLVFLVNPDARLEPGATATMVHALQSSPQVGAAGARVTDPAQQYTAASAGADPSLRSIAGHYLFLSRAPVVGRALPPLHLVDDCRPADVDWVSGAAMVVRQAALASVGGFDERLFMYMEDVDLCLRLREAGWRVRYVPGAVARHAMGGSQGGEQAARWYVAFHGYVARRHGEPYARIGSLLAAAGLAARALATARSRRPHSRRMATAARAALTCGLRGQGAGGTLVAGPAR